MSSGVLWKKVSLTDSTPFPTAYCATATGLSAFGYGSHVFMLKGGVIRQLTRPGDAGEDSACFIDIRGLCFSADDTLLYVSCSGTHTVYSVDCNSGSISKYAGNGQSGFKNGPLADSQFSSPGGICLCSNGDIAICDTDNHMVRRISSTEVSILAGDGVPFYSSGRYDSASLFRPRYIHVDLEDGLVVVCNASKNGVMAHIRSNGFVKIESLDMALLDILPYPAVNSYLYLRPINDVEPVSTITVVSGRDILDSFRPTKFVPLTSFVSAPAPSTPTEELSSSASSPSQPLRPRAPPLPSLSVLNRQTPSIESSTSFALPSDEWMPVYAMAAIKRFVDIVSEARDVCMPRASRNNLARQILGIAEEDDLILLVYDDCWSLYHGGRKQELVEPSTIVKDILTMLSETKGPEEVAELVMPDGEVVSESAEIGEILLSVWLKSKGTVPLFTLSPKGRLHTVKCNDFPGSSITIETRLDGFTLKKLTQKVDVYGFSEPLLIKRNAYGGDVDAVSWTMALPQTRNLQVTSESCPIPVSVRLDSYATPEEVLAKLSTIIEIKKRAMHVLAIALPGEGPKYEFELPVHSWPKCSAIHILNVPTVMVFVKTLAGNTLTLRLSQKSSVFAAKAQITEREGIPTDQQRLIFAGRQLEECKGIDTYNIRNESTLQLIIRLSGG